MFVFPVNGAECAANRQRSIHLAGWAAADGRMQAVRGVR